MIEPVHGNKQYWDDAYDNSKAVGGSGQLLEAWNTSAEQFRQRTRSENRFLPDISYAQGPRHCFDLFLPENDADSLGLVMFVHGGYWQRLGREVFSHLANGPVTRGWSVAIPSYDLCPDVGIPDIVEQMAQALESAVEQTGGENKPIRLLGHSAGGHLVTRLVSQAFSSSENPGDPMQRKGINRSLIKNIKRVVSVSGLHDLRPLINTSMNEVLLLDRETATKESPALLSPISHLPVTCWVGGNELPELQRQSSLLANIWRGFGIPIEAIAEPAKNHFDVIESLALPTSPLVDKLLS